MDSSFVEHVMGRVSIDGHGCWNSAWLKHPKGYSKISRNGKMYFVHRIMYEMLVGPIPPGLHIDHKCSNRRCCNPEHLEPVTPAENNRRANERHPLGHIRAKTHCLRGHEYPADRKPRTTCKLCRAELRLKAA